MDPARLRQVPPFTLTTNTNTMQPTARTTWSKWLIIAVPSAFYAHRTFSLQRLSHHHLQHITTVSLMMIILSTHLLISHPCFSVYHLHTHTLFPPILAIHAMIATCFDLLLRKPICSLVMRAPCSAQNFTTEICGSNCFVLLLFKMQPIFYLGICLVWTAALNVCSVHIVELKLFYRSLLLRNKLVRNQLLCTVV